MEIRVRKSHTKRNIIIFIFVIGILYALITFIRTFHKPEPVPPKDVLSEATNITTVPSQKPSLLPQIVQNELIGTTGKYGIVVVNLQSGERYLANEHRVYKSASLYKLWVMGTVFEQIKDGILKENDVLSEPLIDLYKKFNLATESAQIQPDPEGAPIYITYTVSDALEKMITLSDNNAALLLTAKVRLANIASFLEKHELSESKLGVNGGYPTVTPSDVALFFIKLYKGDLAPHEYTEKMLGLLRRQRLNNKLPKYLPEDIIVGHKTGELDEFTHDAGIVYAPTGDYLIVVLSESNSRFQAEERIANVSKAVYEYFSGN